MMINTQVLDCKGGIIVLAHPAYIVKSPDAPIKNVLQPTLLYTVLAGIAASNVTVLYMYLSSYC